MPIEEENRFTFQQYVVAFQEDYFGKAKLQIRSCSNISDCELFIEKGGDARFDVESNSIDFLPASTALFHMPNILYDEHILMYAAA